MQCPVAQAADMDELQRPAHGFAELMDPRFILLPFLGKNFCKCLFRHGQDLI